MGLAQLLEHFDNGLPIQEGADLHQLLFHYSQEALRLTAELNNAFHTPEDIRKIMSELTGRQIDSSFNLFPPFYTDFGKNLAIGKNVFINSCCNFQDQGGITIKDGALIGHKVVLATINHGYSPEKTALELPSPHCHRQKCLDRFKRHNSPGGYRRGQCHCGGRSRGHQGCRPGNHCRRSARKVHQDGCRCGK